MDIKLATTIIEKTKLIGKQYLLNRSRIGFNLREKRILQSNLLKIKEERSIMNR